MNPRVIIAGGGTGGHIFPAIAIAGELKQRMPQAKILFVGAKGGMETRVVPQYGYPIKAVWISGIQRQLSLRNLARNCLFPIKFFVSLWQAMRIHHRFRPQVVVGVGGYASGPMGRVAAARKTPLVLCEQNAFPGLVNRWLAKKADKILLGNEAARRFFDADKVTVTGNPIRPFDKLSHEEAAARFDLDPTRPIVLSVGGSLGALSINEALQATAAQLLDAGAQLVWQTGKRYYEKLNADVPAHPNLRLMPFVEDMAAAYAAADLVISRAGGSTISEMIALNKTAILVPSPNVAEDHQTRNARSLADHGMAVMIPDSEAREKLIPAALALIQKPEKIEQISHKLSQLKKHKASTEIVDQIIALISS